MSAIDRSRPGMPPRRRQRGAAAVEFSLVAILFFTLVFGIIEVARAMYLCNTLQEVTRRAGTLATNTDFSDAAAMQQVRQRAIFRSNAGFLVFGEPVTDQHIIIDYMRVRQAGNTLAMERIPAGAMPANPRQNQVNCAKDPYGDSCIRLVRVRVCQPGSGADCERATYTTVVSLVPMPFCLPSATTIVNAETLGLTSGLPTCEC